jgi:hypothetical protein
MTSEDERPVNAKETASSVKAVLEKPIPGEFLMVAGLLMVPYGWFIAHHWGWILGGVLVFFFGTQYLKPLECGEKERGCQGEGDGTLKPLEPHS